MVFRYKKILVLFVLMFSFCLVPLYTLAGSTYQDNAIIGLFESAQIGLGDGSNANSIPFYKKEPTKIVGQVVGIALSFLGVLFFGLFIYAGFNWMLARGNQEEIKKSIETIIAAVFGMIIVLAAYAVIYFLTNSFTGK